MVLMADIFLAGIILLTFAFFHHVFPAMISEMERQQELQDPIPSETLMPAMPGNTRESTVSETIPAAAPDDRTPWQIRFEGKFTDEVYKDADDYSSPEVSISVETRTVGEGEDQTVYHVADIYIADPSNFGACTADNEIRYFGTQDVMEMTEASGAILAISGDFITYQKGGFLVGTPFLVLAGAACGCSILTGIVLYGAWRRENSCHHSEI